MLVVGMMMCVVAGARGADPPGTPEPARIRIDPGHPWRPPFGLDRVGQPLPVVVEITADPQPQPDYSLTAYLDGEAVGREPLVLQGHAPYTNRVTFGIWPTELVLAARGATGPEVEVVRHAIQAPAFEAAARARPDRVINPVDLGTVLPPHDWLHLAGGQAASVEVAILARTRDLIGARLAAWFGSQPSHKTSLTVDLARNRRRQFTLRLPSSPTAVERDVVHTTLVDADGQEIWRQQIQALLVPHPPKWPEFGATETMLRYDLPISVLDRDTGALSSLAYTNGWAPHLKDVVVALPNGARFVFWRGSSYVPFWAGLHNTGLSYEWAETGPLPEGFVDSVEPLMDKELRYGRVQILESTAARVRVRWSYQSCDFLYKVWGDSAYEDFCFYPDGFGTRVLNLQSRPGSDYEISELIILTPPAAYPLEVLPSDLIDLVPVDGQPKRRLTFPGKGVEASRSVPLVCRVRLHKDDPMTAVYFNPEDTFRPEELVIFQPFVDQGYVVTPAYWGSHWPLARGKTTGGSIDSRIALTPSHNSLLSWARHRPPPLSTRRLTTLDTLGQAKPMVLQRWVWLIGMTDAPDGRVVERARSFLNPPSLKLEGARLDVDPYVPERRAIRVVVEQSTVVISIQPGESCVNPVFELLEAPKELVDVQLDGRPVPAADYAWDGQTLWLNASLDRPAQLRLAFEEGRD